MDYFNGDDLANQVWSGKYKAEGEQSPSDMHQRMAKQFFRIDSKYQQYDVSTKQLNSLSEYGQLREELTEEAIFKLFDRFKYIIPQGSVMASLGTNELTSLSNCFVIDSPEDSYSGIIRTDGELVHLMKRRGGVGFDISTLRPRGAGVNNAAKSSTGAVSFMERYSNTTREVAQEGRRGALMLSMDINHPDVMEFIKIKRDLSKVTGANISLKMNRGFIEAAKNDKDYILRFPCNISDSVIREDIQSRNMTISDFHDPSKLYKLENAIIGTYYIKVVSAKDYWDEIIKSAHGFAEPGLLLWDNILDKAPESVYPQYQAICTNPCCFGISSRVDVITKKGIKDIKEITPDDLVWLQNENKFVPTKGYTNYGVADTYKVSFSNGDELILTNNHKLARIKPKRIGSKLQKNEFELIELKDLKIGDEIRIHNSLSESFGSLGNKKEGYILGWLSGDGCLSYPNKDDNFPTMYLDFWEKKHSVAEVIKDCINNDLNFNNTILEYKNNGNLVRRIRSSRLTQYFTEKFETNLWKFRKGRNEFLYKASKEFIQGYLAAYFTADGTVQNSTEQSRFNISLSSIDIERLKQVNSLLLNFGIRSSIGLSKKAGSNTDYSFENSKDCYRLTISGIANIRLFNTYIGFLNSFKQERLDEICKRDFKYQKSLSYTKIASIKYNGKEEVGCIEVPEYHYFTANSIISGNSEIAMQKFDACRLMAVNLFSFVDNPFTDKAMFDFYKFYKVNYEAMRLSDNLVDLEIENINRIIEYTEGDERNLWQKIKTTASNTRRTGLGFTALGDMLAALGIKYGSDEALEIIEKIMKVKMESELDCTIDLAILRGTFGGWDKNKEFEDCENGIFKGKDQFYNFIANKFPKQSHRMADYGRRNISVSTVAPTGSVSILTQTTSGIEPLFQPYYIRRKKVNPNDNNTRVDYTDQNGDKWQEFPVLHPKFREWINTNFDNLGMSGFENINKLSKEELQKYFEKSPWYGSTANDVPWKKRLAVQGIIQQFITHSISSTINLPNDVSEEEIANIYYEAYNNGLKGITVYRDGSRSGVLINRDLEIKGKAYPGNILSEHEEEKLSIIIGEYDNNSVEVFTSEQYIVGEGTIIKIGEDTYKFVQPDAEFQLGKRKFLGDLNMFNKRVAQLLQKNYIESLTLTCDNCGSHNVINQEGCVTCLDCGSSKCSI